VSGGGDWYKTERRAYPGVARKIGRCGNTSYGLSSPAFFFFSSCVSCLFLLASFNSFHLMRTIKADVNYRKKLEETTKEDKRRRRQAEAKFEACQRDINEAKEKQKVIRQETREETRQDKKIQDKT
jgi:F0F1-type ATP synthase membrane subunit b/b'